VENVQDEVGERIRSLFQMNFKTVEGPHLEESRGVTYRVSNQTAGQEPRVEVVVRFDRGLLSNGGDTLIRYTLLGVLRVKRVIQRRKNRADRTGGGAPEEVRICRHGVYVKSA